MQSDRAEMGTRHSWSDRLFHWVMALNVVVLCATAFLPILGVRFDWLPIHWISGLVLAAAILFHLLRVALVHGIGEMMPGREDVRELLIGLSGRAAALKQAKYDAHQKGYHWAVALALLAVTITGLVMLLKIDTPMWRRDPSIMTDQQWGVVYVIHGLSSLAILFLILVHLYFSILPEHRALLRSMIAGRGPLWSRGVSHDQNR